jgi:hypothetical protein
MTQFLSSAGRSSEGVGGRPSLALEILAIFWRRRVAKIQYRTKIAEAREIRAEWLSHFPTERTPGLSTIRRHLPAAKTESVQRAGVMTVTGTGRIRTIGLSREALADVAEGEMH